jgi:hypothetical protein
MPRITVLDLIKIFQKNQVYLSAGNSGHESANAGVIGRIAFCQHGCAVGAVRSSAAGVESAAVVIECAAFWRIQILSRSESGRGP